MNKEEKEELKIAVLNNILNFQYPEYFSLKKKERQTIIFNYIVAISNIFLSFVMPSAPVAFILLILNTIRSIGYTLHAKNIRDNAYQEASQIVDDILENCDDPDGVGFVLDENGHIKGILASEKAEVLDAPDPDREYTPYEEKADALAQSIEKAKYPGYEEDLMQIEGLMQGYYLEGEDSYAKTYEQALAQMEQLALSKGISRKRKRK